ARMHVFRLLCAYPMENFHQEADGPSFERVLGTHGEVHPTERYRGDDATQKREVTLLQQRARALENEVAQRKKAEEKLREAAERERSANRAKDEFLAMLGHELRNPLSPILTALQLMQLRLGETASRERTVIERQVEHLVRLVDDLLDISRITRGKIELKK